MEEMSLIDKFGVLFDNILNHPLFIIFFFIPIILFFLRKKHGKKVYVIVYFISIIAILFIFGDVLFKLFDNLMDGIFMTLYFPNFITLFIVVILCALMGLFSLFSTKMHKVNKIINYIGFLVIYSLFALVLVTIQTNKINIYKDNALYSNNDVLALMQLLIGAFAIQVISILIINIINKVTSILDKKESVSSINQQINSLKKNKIKTINIDNDKVGYINVADKKTTSVPLLKPFKFNIDKIESIKFDVVDTPKIITPIKLENKNVSYLNEINPINIYDENSKNNDYVEALFEEEKPKIIINSLDTNKNVYLEVNEPIKPLNLDIENVSYFKEILYPKKFKPSKINSLKIAYLNTNKKYKANSLTDKPVYYLNEVKPKVKQISLEFDKINKIEVNGKFMNKVFNTIKLKDKDFSYFNEVVKPKRFNLISLDSNKMKSIEFSKNVPNKVYNIISLDTEKMVYEKSIIPKLGQSINAVNEDNKFDEVFNMKPDLMTAEEEKSSDLIDNLIIIDVQSTLDVVVKYKLMKNVKLKSYNDLLSVDNLNICNFNLLMDIIKRCKINRNY